MPWAGGQFGGTGREGCSGGAGECLFIGGRGEVGGGGVFMVTGNGATAAVGWGAAALLCPFRWTEVEDNKEGERGDMRALGVSGRGRG